MGAHRLVEMDYVGPDVPDEEVRAQRAIAVKRNMEKATNLLRRTLPFSRKQSLSQSDVEKQGSQKNGTPPDDITGLTEKSRRHLSFVDEDTEVGPSQDASRDSSRPTSPKPVMGNRPPFRTRFLAIARSAGRSFLLPCSITIIVSIVIAVVTPLKALFTPVDNSSIPDAPDGHPPLYFILDCADFVGAASVPVGLVCLGSAIARVKLPRKGEWGKLPIGAILYFALTKLALLPVLGVLIIQGLVRVGFIDRDDKVLRFVCM